MSRKQKFKERWKCHLAGLALYGVASETKDGVLARAARVLDIPAEVERLLDRLHDSLDPRTAEDLLELAGAMSDAEVIRFFELYSQKQRPTTGPTTRKANS